MCHSAQFCEWFDERLWNVTHDVRVFTYCQDTFYIDMHISDYKQPLIFSTFISDLNPNVLNMHIIIFLK